MDKGCHSGNNFSHKQLRAIQLFAAGRNCKEVAEAINVTPATISRWRHNSEFHSAILKEARTQLKNRLPKIYDVAAGKAEAGSAAHLRILLDHIENLEKNVVDTAQTIVFTWDNA